MLTLWAAKLNWTFDLWVFQAVLYNLIKNQIPAIAFHRVAIFYDIYKPVQSIYSKATFFCFSLGFLHDGVQGS